MSPATRAFYCHEQKEAKNQVNETMTDASRYQKIGHGDAKTGLHGNNSPRRSDSSLDGHPPPLPSSSPYNAADSFKRQWAIALFSITTVLLFADQNLMSPNLTAIARYFGLDDHQRDAKLGGDIALAFFVIGAPASFIVGCLGDSYNRTILFAWSVGIAEGSCLATFFVTTYRQFYWCRAITGFGLGGALPLIYSILGDLYAARDRHVVNAIVGIGTGVGISLGQGIAGFLGPSFGWRLPFLVISIPALVCAALVLWTVEDPERGSMEETVLNAHQHQQFATDEDTTTTSCLSIEMAPLQEATPKPSLVGVDALAGTSIGVEEPKQSPWGPSPSASGFLNTFSALLATPTVILSLLQGAPGCVPWGIVNSFLNDYLAEDRGMSVEAATMVILIFGLGNFFGLLLGGGGGTYLYDKDKRYPPLLAGCMAIGSCFPFWVLLNAVHEGSNPLFILVVALSAGALCGGTGPIVKATLQNVTLPQARGQAFALFNTFDDFGRGLGPVFIAWLINNFGGRTHAFNIGVFGWILCGAMNLAMYFTVARDEYMVQQILTASLSASARESD